MQETPQPVVSVIIPVHGDRGGFAQTLRALQDQDYPGLVEVLLVDNGDNSESTFDDLPRSATMSFRALTETRPGSYAARNAGVASARGQVLAFTDADCLPSSTWLSSAVRALSAPSRTSDFIVGHVELFLLRARPNLAELWELGKAFHQSEYATDGWGATANVVVRRESFDRVGLFNADLLSGGDREWGQRARQVGVQARYERTVVVLHPARGSFRELFVKVRRVTRGHVDSRRAKGVSALTSDELWLQLRLPLRSAWSEGRALGRTYNRAPALYVLVVWLVQYYRLGVMLRLVSECRRTRARS